MPARSLTLLILSAAGTLTLQVQNLINSALIESTTRMATIADSVTNSGTLRAAQLDLKTNTLDNRQGQLLSNGALTVNTTTFTGGTVVANGDLTLNAHQLDASGAQLTSGAQLALSADTYTSDATSTIKAPQLTLNAQKSATH